MLDYEDKKKSRSLRLSLVQICQKEGISSLLAILVVGTSCAIALVQLWRGNEIQIPSYLVEISVLVIGYYFGKSSKG